MNMPKVEFSIPEGHFELFFPLLRQGVRVLVPDGRTVHELLSGDLGLSQETIRTRVQTVFLDGHPVDDLRATCLEEGSTLSLSAAMPGLLGACMRVESPYATMRESISQGHSARPSSSPGTSSIGFTLKLFNFMAQEVGPCVLSRGVEVDADRVLELIGRAREEHFWEAGLTAALEGQPVNPDQDPLAARFAAWKTVFVRVVG